jgi:predicted Zn-dependent peptidase
MTFAFRLCQNGNVPATNNVHRDVLSNGLVIITEPMPHVRSVTVGIWVRSGSRAEPAERNGISHFIEHMVFKGTERRTAEEIARSVDSVGGMLDAFTTKEMICFNAKVLDEHLPVAFDVLSDMVLRPLFSEEDIVKEKHVVLEEIKMDEDNPDYLVHEIFTQNFWRGHALGKPILGTPDTVGQFSRDTLLDSFRRWYAPNNIVISAAGHLEHAQLVDLVTREFGRLPAVPDGFRDPTPQPHPQIAMRSKQALEQVQICLGVPSYPMAHERRYATAVLNVILGSGMSSRLFQNIREKQGLAYAVFSELSPYRDAGVLLISAGTARETTGQLIHSVAEEFRNLKQEPVSDEELRRAKDHLKGSLMLSLESTSARMTNLARQEMYFGRFFTLEELLASIERVSREDVQLIAREFFTPERIGVAVLGNLDGFALTPDQLAC